MDLSVVIPVYNSEGMLGELVKRLQASLNEWVFEIVLVNDGSRDKSEQVGQQVAERYPNVRFISLRRNFGEFNAVLCGLTHSIGRYVVIIDDDFQNPPESILTLVRYAEANQYDVVYSRYAQKQHHWFRNLGSKLVNTLTTYTLGKPRDLYLSSFKLIQRDVVQEICKYRGPYPYIDGLIFRVTQHVGSVEVPHHHRAGGKSNYTVRKLIGLFLNVFIGYSIWPIRVCSVLGILLVCLSVVSGLGLWVYWLIQSISVPGWVVVVWAVGFALGVQMVFLGIIGEYLGKLFMAYSGLPPYVEKQKKA